MLVFVGNLRFMLEVPLPMPAMFLLLYILYLFVHGQAKNNRPGGFVTLDDIFHIY